MSLEEELREERERTELERIKSAVREELADLESRMMTGITERIGSGTAQRSTSSCRFFEIQIRELYNGVGNLAHTISVVTSSFNERFPPRPKGLMRRIGKIALDYYPYLFFAALL